MWYQNLYILALNAAEGSDSAPGLYGSFVTADQMLWAGDLTLNYNAGAMRLCPFALLPVPLRLSVVAAARRGAVLRSSERQPSVAAGRLPRDGVRHHRHGLGPGEAAVPALRTRRA